MNLLKKVLFSSFGALVILSSCKKNEVEDLKDYSYFKKNISSDKNIKGMFNTLNEGINAIELFSNNRFTKTVEFKTLVAREFSKEKVNNRAKTAANYFGKFIEENPEFNRLTQSQKIELLKTANKGTETFEENFFALKTFGDGCMDGFNHMANVCSSGRDDDRFMAVLDPDPFMWLVNFAVAEMAYGACLNDAADAMDICGRGTN